ncbi:FkbM family methyltransferase [Actinomarinicola tropica]|uniref:FkbM family methyltransferase n=1 Tax=Actinomarinicola tropica TaxID=2789776 RepID=UPI00189860EA|nr:FkbM family methyltransferase [Actinomarinicola tropica]
MKLDVASLKAALVDVLPDPLVYRIAPLIYRGQEPELARLRSFVPRGRNAVDVGGWLGPWTRELSRWCGRVDTFEPQPDLAAFLRKVVPANVTVHEVAVSDAAGRTRLVVPSSRHGENALASVRPGAADADPDAIVHEVDVVRLDDLGFTDVGFLKVDVEGHEREVLDGATALIGRDRPRILLEAEQRHLDTPLHELFDHVGALGYRGWFLHGGGWHALDTFDVEQRQTAHLDDLTGPDYVNNFLFVPTEDEFTPTT